MRPFVVILLHPRTPGGKPISDKLRTIIEPHGLRLSASDHNLVESPHHPFGRDGGIHIDRPTLMAPFTQDIQGLKPVPTVERVTHEVDGPHPSGSGHNGQGLAGTTREALLDPSGKIQTQRAIDTPDSFRIPRMTIQPEPPITLPEAPA